LQIQKALGGHLMPPADSGNAGPVAEVEIDGYQSLVGVTIPLSPGVNVIVGESDVGKSAVVRAIQGLISNQRGDGFINNRAGKCRVRMVADSGDTVVWKKPENSYKLNDDEPFRKVGSSVPKEVLGAINMEPLELDKNIARSINIVEQGAPKFLVEDKESDVAKTIGAITRLQPVYNAMRAVAADRRSALGRAKTLVSEASQCRLKLAAFVDLDGESVRLSRATKAMSVCQKLVDRVTQLEELSRRLLLNVEDAESITVKLKSVGAILGASANIKTAKSAWKSRERLGRLRDSLTAAELDTRAISDRANSLDLTLKTDTDALAEAGNKLALLASIQERLSLNCSESSSLEDRIGALLSVVEMGVDRIMADAAKLERVGILQDACTVCDKSLSTLKKEGSAMDCVIEKSGRDVAKLLKSASICPLSGGKLFDECKRLIGEAT